MNGCLSTCQGCPLCISACVSTWGLSYLTSLSLLLFCNCNCMCTHWQLLNHAEVSVCCSDFLETANPMTQLFDPASHTFWRNVKERAVAPVTAFGRNPARWDVWAPETVPPVPTWYASKADVTLLGCIELLPVCAVTVVYCDLTMVSAVAASPCCLWSKHVASATG